MDKVMASNRMEVVPDNLSVHDTEIADICQLSTHQTEVTAQHTFDGFTVPISGDGTTTDRFVVWGLPCAQSNLRRGKKAGCQRVEGSKSSSKGKRKKSCKFTTKNPEAGDCRFSVFYLIKCYYMIAVDHENVIVDVTGTIVPGNDETLPFKKNKLLWGVAESLEAFSIMPQNPHFRPLESKREIFREGKALNLMVLFDKIANNTLNLRCDAPREDIENDLSLLKKLETHGFDVMNLRDRLTRILSLKGRQEDLKNLSKENKRRLLEFDREKCKAKEKHMKIKDKIMELMKETELAASRVKEIDAEFASEQLALRGLDDELARTSTVIEELVASPLY